MQFLEFLHGTPGIERKNKSMTEITKKEVKNQKQNKNKNRDPKLFYLSL